MSARSFAIEWATTERPLADRKKVSEQNETIIETDEVLQRVLSGPDRLKLDSSGQEEIREAVAEAETQQAHTQQVLNTPEPKTTDTIKRPGPKKPLTVNKLAVQKSPGRARQVERPSPKKPTTPASKTEVLPTKKPDQVLYGTVKLREKHKCVIYKAQKADQFYLPSLTFSERKAVKTLLMGEKTAAYQFDGIWYHYEYDKLFADTLVLEHYIRIKVDLSTPTFHLYDTVRDFTQYKAFRERIFRSKNHAVKILRVKADEITIKVVHNGN